MKILVMSWILMSFLTAAGYLYLIWWIKRQLKKDKMKFNHSAFDEEKPSTKQLIGEIAELVAATIFPIFHIAVFVMCIFFPYLVYNKSINEGKIIDDREE